MLSLRTNSQTLFEENWREQLSEYITDLVWSNHDYLGVSSAAGEVLLWEVNTHQSTLILSPEDTKEQSIDCLKFSHDGKFLATAGQEGKVRIWQIKPEIQLINTWGQNNQWIEHLSWHPNSYQLAFGLGHYVQILDVISGEIIVTLPFESSSILDIAWHPLGESLAIAGNGGVKIWETNQWDDDPIWLEMPAACTAIAWSNDGEYLAARCFDNTVLVLRFQDENPWRMTGFGGKIRHLTWSNIKSGIAPLLAVACLEGIIVWKKEKNDEDGWISRVLIAHEDMITNLAFQPNSLLLGSTGEDGQLLLWQKAKQLSQRLGEVSAGFSCLAWHPLGHKLAAGGTNGELIILTTSKRGKGFG